MSGSPLPHPWGSRAGRDWGGRGVCRERSWVGGAGRVEQVPGEAAGPEVLSLVLLHPPLRGTQEQSPPSRGCSAVRSVCAGSWGGTPGLCRANWKESGTARSQQLEGLSRQCPGSWPYPWRPTQQEEGSCTTERLFAQTHSQGPKALGRGAVVSSQEESGKVGRRKGV